MRYFYLKTCDSCRKTLRSLREMGFEPDLVELRQDGASDLDLDAMVAAFGDKVINKRSTSWRELDEAARVGDPRDLIAAHPTLIKRPVIEHQGVMYQGLSAALKAALSA